jgi:hypothetical protein
MGAGQGELVDHRSRVTLDNRRSNLRTCSLSQNNQNSSLRKNNKSGFIGVSLGKRHKKFAGCISVGGKTKYVAYCFCPVKAAMLRDIEAIKAYKEFANLNNVICNCLPVLRTKEIA